MAPLLDLTYVCNVIGGIIKNIQIEFFYGGWPSYRAKSARYGTKDDLDG